LWREGTEAPQILTDRRWRRKASGKHFHIPIYGPLGSFREVGIYNRQTIPDEGQNILSSYYPEQIFLFWKL